METQGKQYKWEILAWSAIRRDGKKWTLQESQWFNKKEDCITDFKQKMSYDIVDSWGSEEYLLKRRVMPKKYFPQTLRESDSYNSR
jgi:hypothetical protein